MIIINDTHFSFHRKGGTTPKSQEALRTYLYSTIEKALMIDDPHVLILGDIFDEFEVTNRDLVDVLALLQRTVLTPGRRLTLIAGNHDTSMKGLKVGSFSVLAAVLKSLAPDKVQIVDINDVAELPGGYVVAHCQDQKMFDTRLDGVLAVVEPGDIVYLHANYANPFAAQSDHSLNVSEEVARRFKAKDSVLVFAHEHQAKTALGGSVVILGNQASTSIADCLGNDKKFAHVVDGENCIHRIETWDREKANGFAEIDWRELTESNADFIRVTGTASANEASDLINKIAKFRQVSEAFVITNAVKVEGMSEIGTLPETFEAIKKFDVMEFIAQYLNEAEMKIVKELAA